jgi:hypothetical protein
MIMPHPRFKSAAAIKSFRSDRSRIPSRIHPIKIATDLLVAADDGEMGDRIWYMNNRTRYYRLRHCTDTELRFKELKGDGDRAIGVMVKMIAERHRLRVFFLSTPFRKAWQFDDDVCAALFAQLQRMDPQIGWIAEQLLIQEARP